MAIYHCSAKIISRSSGRSSVAAAAYRSGANLLNERDGVRHDYTAKSGVVYSDIILPDNAPIWASEREKLWNEVEKIEKSKNSQLAREVEVSLPMELSREQQIQLIRNYAQQFANQGMVADFSVHDKNVGNPHAHIMLTTRPFKIDGSWGAKAKKQYVLNKDGKRIKLKSGEWKSQKIDTTDWNKQETLEAWRKQWETTANKALENAGYKERINCRSYTDQGIEEIPTRHIGPTAAAMEKRGISSELGDINRTICQKNIELRNLKMQLGKFKLEINTIRDALNRKPETTEDNLQLLYECKYKLNNIIAIRQMALENLHYANAQEVQELARQSVLGASYRDCKQDINKVEQQLMQSEQLAIIAAAKVIEKQKNERPEGIWDAISGKTEKYDKELVSLQKNAKAENMEYNVLQDKLATLKQELSAQLLVNESKIAVAAKQIVDQSDNSAIALIYKSTPNGNQLLSAINRRIHNIEKIVRAEHKGISGKIIADCKLKGQSAGRANTIDSNINGKSTIPKITDQMQSQLSKIIDQLTAGGNPLVAKTHKEHEELDYDIMDKVDREAEAERIENLDRD